MTIYRLPFLGDGLWHGTRNWDDPSGNGHDPYQAYAFDISHPLGGTVLAARSGHVISVEHFAATNKLGKGGTLVRIRHADDTVSLYAHLMFNSVLVTANPPQYVFQGTKLGLSGNTGNSHGPHLHFEVRSFWNSEEDQGPTIPIQFEDNFHTAWRPISTDLYGSNNQVLRQEGWRHCKNCHSLFFGDKPSSGTKGGVCPKDTKHGPHSPGNSGSYILSAGSHAKGEKDWQWCSKCQALFFEGLANSSRCPADDGRHLSNGGQGYVIALEADAPGQHNWRACKNCLGMFFAGSGGSMCPLGKEHDPSGSANYSLEGMGPGDVETNWRHCNICRGMFYAKSFVSICPAGGGPHDKTGSLDFAMLHDYVNSIAPGQQGWRRCRKCSGLFFGGNPGSNCPLDQGPHIASAKTYTLLPYRPGAPGQRNWKWCNRCQGLYFGDPSATTCPAGDQHATPGDGDYALLCNGIWGE